MAKGVDQINGLSPQEHAFRSPIVSRQDGGVYWSNGVKWNKLSSEEDMSDINDTLLLILDQVTPNATEAKQDIQITEQADQGLSLDSLVDDMDMQIARGLNPDQSPNIKWGGSTNINSSSVWAPLWAPATIYNWLTTASTIRIKAGGDATDAVAGSHARELIVTALNSSWAEETFTLIPNGVLASAASANTYYRVLTAHVGKVGTYDHSNAGDLILEDTAGLNELLHVEIEEGRSRHLIYTVPAGHTLYIDKMVLSVGANKSADVRMRWREEADNTVTPVSFQTFPIAEDFNSEVPVLFNFNLPFPEKTDVCLEAKLNSGSGTTSVFGVWIGRLVKN